MIISLRKPGFLPRSGIFLKMISRILKMVKYLVMTWLDC